MYDPNCPTKFLIYLVANNSYGWAMSNCISYSDFALVNCVENKNVLNVLNNSERGYTLLY